MKKYMLSGLLVLFIFNSVNIVLADSKEIDVEKAEQTFKKLRLKRQALDLNSRIDSLKEQHAKILVEMGVFEELANNSLAVRFYELDRDIFVPIEAGVETVGGFTALYLLKRFLKIGPALHGVLSGAVASNFIISGWGYGGLVYHYYIKERANIVAKLQNMNEEEALSWYSNSKETLERLNQQLKFKTDMLSEINDELARLD